MGRALLSGFLRAGLLPRGHVLVCARESAASTAQQFAEFGVRAVDSDELWSRCDVVILAVKPTQVDAVVAGRARSSQTVISVVAGWSVERLRAALKPATVVRTMPNVACSVGAGITLILDDPAARPAIELAVRLFSAVGVAEVLLSEEHFHAATAVAGCGPAFIFLVQEAMADGAVCCGLPRAQAQRLSAAVIKGAGELALSSGLHPGVLKDSVCSPGGITIRGVRILESHSARAAFLEAVAGAAERSSEMQRERT